MKSLNVKVSPAGMISLLLLAASLTGISSLVPTAAASLPVDDTIAGGNTSATTRMADDTPSNSTTTLNVDLSDEPFAVGQYRTVVSDNMTSETKVRFTFKGNTTITIPNSTETINTKDRGRGSITFLTGGGGAIAGKIRLITEDRSENATVQFTEFFKDEISRGIGVAYFSTNSTGMLAPLNNMIAGFIDEEQPNGDSILRFFEWKSGGVPIGNDNSTTFGSVLLRDDNSTMTTNETSVIPTL
jgi:hypothetical protein